MSRVDIDHCAAHALSTKVSALRQLPVFQQCRDSIVHKVAQQLQTRFLEPGEIVCRSGEESDHVFLLAFGSVQVWSDGQESADLCDAGIIGDPRVLLRSCVDNQYNVVAKTFCQMHKLTSSQFRQVAGIKDDVQDLSKCLEQLKIPWPTTRKPSFLRATKTQLRVVQFVNAISAGRKKTPAVVPPPRPPEPQPQEKKDSAAKRRQTAKLQTAKLHGKLKANKDKLDEGNEEKETGGQKDTLTFNSEAQKMEISKSLQTLDFFSTLDTFSFERLIALFQKKFWRKNEPLLTEGKPAKAMHVVLQGDVNIIIGGKVLNKLGSNSVVGERSVLSSTSGDPAPCGATVTAASPIVMTASATRAHLQDLFFKDAGLLEHFQSRFDVERHRRGVTSFRNVKLFREADPGFTQALEVAVKERVYNDGEYMVTEGMECHEAVMLCRGTVNILSDDVVVATISVQQMEDSIIFGEFTLMGIWDAPRASIVAVNTCLVQVIHQDALRQCLDLYPDESFIFRELVEIRLEKIYQQEAEVKRQKSQTSLGGNSNPEQDADASNNAEAGLGGNSPQARPAAGNSPQARSLAVKRKTLPRGIREVKDFKVLSAQCMRELELYLHKRLFMKDQVIVHQGTDLQDVYVLQQGTCEAKVFGASFEIMKGHCVIGGLPSVLTKKSVYDCGHGTMFCREDLTETLQCDVGQVSGRSQEAVCCCQSCLQHDVRRLPAKCVDRTGFPGATRCNAVSCWRLCGVPGSFSSCSGATASASGAGDLPGQRQGRLSRSLLCVRRTFPLLAEGSSDGDHFAKDGVRRLGSLRNQRRLQRHEDLFRRDLQGWGPDARAALRLAARVPTGKGQVRETCAQSHGGQRKSPPRHVAIPFRPEQPTDPDSLPFIG